MSSKQQPREGSQKQKDVRSSNIIAAGAVADAIRTSLGPKGMDKMIQGSDGEVSITNDGATILKKMELMHPTAKMLVDLAKAQDVEAGDGTTTVTVLAGSLLHACQKLLDNGIHPTIIVENFQIAAKHSIEILKDMSFPVDLSDRDSLIQSAATSLSSKVVAQYSNLLAPIAVDAVRHIIDISTDTNVDLNCIKMVKKVGGTIDDTELVEGLILTQTSSKVAGGPSSIKDAKIGLIQFQLSPPKSNMENKIIIDNYSMLDRMLKQERRYILDIIKQINKTGCNVLLIQKSILRDAVSELALNYLAKMKIMVVKDIERDDIEFISKTLGAIPIASIEAFSRDKLGSAGIVEEVSTSGGKIIKVTGVPTGNFISIFIRGSNALVLDEAERSLHDALCVVRSLVKERNIIVGGAAGEIEIIIGIKKLAMKQPGLGANVFRAFAHSFEVIPYTLAENAGLNPIRIVTELLSQHSQGYKNFGINMRTGVISDMKKETVTQPLLVSTSAITLAVETVNMILKIDDVILVR